MHTDSSGAMNVAQTKSTMHSLAFGQAMAAAAEDYKRVSAAVVGRGPTGSAPWRASSCQKTAAAWAQKSPARAKQSMPRPLRCRPAAAPPQDVLAQQASAGPSHAAVDIDDLLDDPDLERLHAERLAQLKTEAEKRAQLQQKGHGACAGGAAAAGAAGVC